MGTLNDDIEALRAIPAKWKYRTDPLGDLAKLRAGEDIEPVVLTAEQQKEYDAACEAYSQEVMNTEKH